MKPESQSQITLSITQSKAKMYEYNVPLNEHINPTIDPKRLFPLTVGILGDLAANISDGTLTELEVEELRNSLPFSARFFDSFVETRLDSENNDYIRLLGATAYYLCDLPGSSNVIAKKLNNNNANPFLGLLGLENLLVWLLLIKEFPASFPELQDSPYRIFIETIRSSFLEFTRTGIQIDSVVEATSQLKLIAYDIGTPRELLITDLITAVIYKRIENSTWICLPRYSELPVSVWTSAIQKNTFVKELWPAQHLLGRQGVFRGRSAVIQMPTSAGKTKATEIIIRSTFLSNRALLAVIIAPFRALCHEIRQGLLKAFQNENIFVDELSDVLQMDLSIDRYLMGQQILVSTPEKFNYVLRHEPRLAQNIGLIIYDEGHQFDNGNRGITFELLLTALKSRIPESAQTVLISAVISNARQIAQWLIGDNAETVEGAQLIPTFRSIGFSTTASRGRNINFVNPNDPDEISFFLPRIFIGHPLSRRRTFPNFSRGREIALFLGLKLVPQGSVAIFSGTKVSVTKMCETIVKAYANGLSAPSPKEYSNSTEVEKLKQLHDLNLGEDSPTAKCAQLGIFAHHNNVPHGLRLSIEYAIKESLAKFVICTSTLAQGVNLPIRYLIVTSVYQGEEQISVRDFQNLIGRSGRSGIHTEGSILFADPAIYDERNRNFVGRRKWEQIKELLDPSKSEKCESKLLSLFEPLYSFDRQNQIELNISILVDIYLEGQVRLRSWIEELAGQLATQNFNASGLQFQIEQKLNIISAIESYLMANSEPDRAELEKEAVINLAKGTLAYFLANDAQKTQIEELFLILARNIETYIPEVSARIIFGKTMYGVPDSLAILRWLEEHSAELNQERPPLELLTFLWPLVADNIHNNSFKKCNQPLALLTLLLSWVEGKSYHQLFIDLTSSGAKLIAGQQLRSYKIDHIVDICENGLAYEGILVFGALIELIPTLHLENIGFLISQLQLLQKRLKYGLPNEISIILYELGFADRIVAIDLSTLLSDALPEKNAVKLALRARREEVFEKLNLYPRYFSEVYENQVAT